MVNEKLIAFANMRLNECKKKPCVDTIDNLFQVAKLCIEQFQDEKYALKITAVCKKFLINLIGVEKEYDFNHKTFMEFDDFARTHGGRHPELLLYWTIMRYEATFWLDSYCLYIEKDRPIRERFYQPRRKTLIKVITLLQKLEDDELDEVFIHQPARTGKLISDDCPVLTSNGWKNHGDLVVGDLVIGSDGSYTKVTQVHPKHHTTHTVTISDGTKIDCHYNHEWTVYNRQKHIYETVSTSEMISKLRRKNDSGYNYYLPKKPYVDGEFKQFDLPPYVLGVWLGDGTNKKPCITEPESDIDIIHKIERLGFPLEHVYTHKTTGVNSYYFGRKLVDCLRKYGMCYYTKTSEKYIPEEYLTASIEQRLQLIAGLIDTDGTLRVKENRYSFTTTSKRLRDDFITLVNTFGWRTCVVEYKPIISSSGICGRKTNYCISFNPDTHIPCALYRKKLYEFSEKKRLSIVSIEESKQKPGNCISVENSDGIYLVGKTLVPTHNSQAITMATAWHCARHDEYSNLYVTYKEGLGGAFLDGVMEIWSDPMYAHLDVFPGCKIARTDAKNHKVDIGRKKKYASLSGKGLESGLNGEYDAYGWLIVDDVLEGIQDVLNPDILHRKQIVFDNNVMKRKKEKCKVIYNGTIWSLHDIYMNRLGFLENNPEANGIRYEVLKLPALDPETDESNFDYDYGVGFSTSHYRMERAKFEENDDYAGWCSQCQQEPIERDGAVFNPDFMRFFNGQLPSEEPLKIVAACDVALGGRDYLSMPIAFCYEDGSIYIPDVVFSSEEKKITQPEIVEKIIKYNVKSAFFESNAGGEGYKDDIDRLLKEHKEFNGGRGINLVSAYASTEKRKEQRIWDNAEEIRKIYFLDSGYRDKSYRAFMTNVFSFTINGKNKHDDGPDSLASLVEFINNGSGVKISKIIRGGLI